MFQSGRKNCRVECNGRDKQFWKLFTFFHAGTASVCTPRCHTCRRNAADEQRCSADAFSVDDGSAIRLFCLLIVSNINGSPYSQAVLHFQVLHFPPLNLVLHFQVLHFPPLQFGPPFSGPAFSGPAFSAPPIKLLCCSCNVFYSCLRTLKLNTLAYTYASFKNRIRAQRVSSSLGFAG